MTTYVYRAFDRIGRLLYIGVTKGYAHRIKAHRKTGSPWLRHAVRIELQGYAEDLAARAAERLAILLEHPIFNVHGRDYLHPHGYVSRVCDVVYPPTEASVA